MFDDIKFFSPSADKRLYFTRQTTERRGFKEKTAHLKSISEPVFNRKKEKKKNTTEGSEIAVFPTESRRKKKRKMHSGRRRFVFIAPEFLFAHSSLELIISFFQWEFLENRLNSKTNKWVS